MPNPKGRTYTNFLFVVRSAEISRISRGQGGALAIIKLEYLNSKMKPVDS